MKFPKVVNAYCPRCNAYTEHTVSIYSHGKRRNLAEGQRRYLRKLKGYGSSRKPKQKRFAKTTKVVVLKLQCRQCGYVIMKPLGRLKKVELTEVR
ncbi:50S ribosomal protein L44e [Vulcanisaeta thermophila]|uniref:50S ribosomal protein L44e n=1 Tax=Vulcanisaeta thermophila TaxID=867917 RepID=UPI00085309B6|nr:50S ribosomal protein L44e [Vulcanisaeta thermophila]